MPTLRIAAALLLLASLASPAQAGVNKDMVQLQTQIQQLQDAVARLQQSNDERMGVLKDLVQQSADSVNRMSVNMDAMQKQLAAGPAANSVKLDQLSGQVQSLNDTLDEVKARMARLEKLLGNVENQQQSMAAAIQNLPATQPQTSPQTPPPTAQNSLQPDPSTAPAGTPLTAFNSAPSRPTPATRPSATTTAPAAAPAPDLYKNAYNDYVAAKYAIASSEFNDIVKAYPDNTLAGNSWYYLGEIEYRAGHYSAAARDYDKVLEQFPDSNKIPASHLHKGQALVEMKQTDKAALEFRTLIQRFPNSPEAASARSKLNALGIPIKPRTP